MTEEEVKEEEKKFGEDHPLVFDFPTLEESMQYFNFDFENNIPTFSGIRLMLKDFMKKVIEVEFDVSYMQGEDMHKQRFKNLDALDNLTISTTNPYALKIRNDYERMIKEYYLAMRNIEYMVNLTNLVLNLSEAGRLVYLEELLKNDAKCPECAQKEEGTQIIDNVHSLSQDKADDANFEVANDEIANEDEALSIKDGYPRDFKVDEGDNVIEDLHKGKKVGDPVAYDKSVFNKALEGFEYKKEDLEKKDEDSEQIPSDPIDKDDVDIPLKVSSKDGFNISYPPQMVEEDWEIPVIRDRIPKYLAKRKTAPTMMQIVLGVHKPKKKVKKVLEELEANGTIVKNQFRFYLPERAPEE